MICLPVGVVLEIVSDCTSGGIVGDVTAFFVPGSVGSGLLRMCSRNYVISTCTMIVSAFTAIQLVKLSGEC